MKPYADTNFLVRLYLDVEETERAVRLVQKEDSRKTMLPVGWLHRVEMTNALQSYVFLSRQGRGRRISPEAAQAAHASFRSDLQQTRLLAPADLTVAELEGQFEELALRHTARYGFRTYDLLHVASALLLGCDTFWSFDLKALSLARLEGLSSLKQT